MNIDHQQLTNSSLSFYILEDPQTTIIDTLENPQKIVKTQYQPIFNGNLAKCLNRVYYNTEDFVLKDFFTSNSSEKFLPKIVYAHSFEPIMAQLINIFPTPPKPLVSWVFQCLAMSRDYQFLDYHFAIDLYSWLSQIDQYMALQIIQSGLPRDVINLNLGLFAQLKPPVSRYFCTHFLKPDQSEEAIQPYRKYSIISSTQMYLHSQFDKKKSLIPEYCFMPGSMFYRTDRHIVPRRLRSLDINDLASYSDHIFQARFPITYKDFKCFQNMFMPSFSAIGSSEYESSPLFQHFLTGLLVQKTENKIDYLKAASDIFELEFIKSIGTSPVTNGIEYALASRHGNMLFLALDCKLLHIDEQQNVTENKSIEEIYSYLINEHNAYIGGDHDEKVLRRQIRLGLVQLIHYAISEYGVVVLLQHSNGSTKEITLKQNICLKKLSEKLSTGKTIDQYLLDLEHSTQIADQTILNIIQEFIVESLNEQQAKKNSDNENEGQ